MIHDNRFKVSTFIIIGLLNMLFMSIVTAGSSDSPNKPVNGYITFGFGKTASWSSKPHTGTDYSSNLGNSVITVGKGTIIPYYTKPDAQGFGSLNPNGKGPAIWVKHKLSDGSPIYVLYGHTASSWTDSSSGVGTQNFKFNCTYIINWKKGDTVNVGKTIGYTAPFYNGGASSTHLHLGVFKPYKNSKTNTYYDPPLSGWGYGDIKQLRGEFIDPTLFFNNYKLDNN